MRKKGLLFFLVAFVTILFIGCGRISNGDITIKKYKGLEIENVKTTQVTDDDVQRKIDALLRTRATEMNITGRGTKKGDIVVLNYEASVGTSTVVKKRNEECEIGADNFFASFEEGLIGHNIGEMFELKLYVPDNFDNPVLAGKEALFKIQISAIREIKIPELTNVVVVELSNTASTPDEYKKEIEAAIQTENEINARKRLEQNVWDTLFEGCIVKKDLSDEAKKELVVKLISEKESLELQDEEYQKGLRQKAEQYGYSDMSEFEKMIGKEKLTGVLLQEKVTNFLIENCKFKSTK